MEKVKQEYTLNGLDCSNCAQKIEHEIAGMKGISKKKGEADDHQTRFFQKRSLLMKKAC
ncbi:cation transporter [Bacillus licheniformis]|nr:cation transporter [Bacillus licheniformis]